MMEVFVTTDGTIRLFYGETIDIASLGHLIIRRASHVEPTANGDWRVDLSPSGGPILGPFNRRSQALAAEECWLNKHVFAPAI